MRISNSFSEGEIQVLDFIVTTLLRGGTPTMAVRSRDFASLCRKVQAMKTRVHEINEGVAQPKSKRVNDKSSVGLIDSPNVDVDVDDASGEESLEDVG